MKKQENLSLPQDVKGAVKTVAALIAALTASTLVVNAAQGPQPPICNRPCWGARAPACGISYMGSLSRAIIHHTANPSHYNTSGQAATAANIRGDQNIHISYGWCDIGYHFLVDKHGNVFEGRHGSLGGLPRGAHDSANANSFGFNIMGYYHPPYNNAPTVASRQRLYDVIAWRMPSAWSPYGGAGGYCGSDGCRNVGWLDSHRAVNATACPGDGLHAYITSNWNGGEARNEVNLKKAGCNINLTQGAIRAKYESFGGCGSFLGAPTTGELTTPNGVGKYNHFANNGSIYWTAATGAWEVHGLIRDKWAALGWETSALGFPISDERSTPAGGGKYNVFQNGSIYWTSGTGAHNVQGLIRDKWAQLGWEAGFLGFPTTDESPAANGGRYNHFQGGSIYWSSATGAFSVRGAIKDKWASLGWENSCLGYPTSDEYDYNGGKRSDFQGGNITWTAAGGAVSSCNNPLLDVTVDNNTAGFSVTGTWTTGTTATDKFGADYRFHSTATVTEPAQWQASLSAGGNYNVSAWWAAGSNRSATAPYTVYHTTGSSTVNKNQQGNGGSWQSLGIFNLNSGNNQVRLSCWTTTGFIVLADAIRWQQQ